MHKYIFKRLLMLIPVVIGISFLVFSIMSLTPGDPAILILGNDATSESLTALRAELGLDKPLIVQYLRYMLNLLHGDFGTGYTTGRDVLTEIIGRVPVTVVLTIMSTLVAVVISIPVGVVSATKQYSLMDSTSMVACLLGVSIPNFWLGLMLIIVFSVNLRWLPSGGAESLKSFILPALTLGFGSAASIARMMRSSMLEVIRQDYIRTAKAKGVRGKDVIRKHALKNALIPVVTVVGLQFGVSLGGAVLTETVFSLPGLGRLMVDAIRGMDTPTVMGCIIIFSVAFSVVNLFVDILYGYLDPRIKSKYQ
ncbi:MAG: ABC transporter permease [Oscillospiraceae bacterium]